MTFPETLSDSQAMRLYTIAEVAHLLSVGRNYVYARIKDGTLPAVNLGAGGGREKLRVRSLDLENFIQAKLSG